MGGGDRVPPFWQRWRVGARLGREEEVSEHSHWLAVCPLSLLTHVFMVSGRLWPRRKRVRQGWVHNCALWILEKSLVVYWVAFQEAEAEALQGPRRALGARGEVERLNSWWDCGQASARASVCRV